MRLYNTLSRSIDDIPHQNDPLKIYTCGLTVYSQPHIGNWIAYIYSDLLIRTLKANNFDIYRVQNITDVGHLTSDDDAGQDKMEKSAEAEGLDAWKIADKYIDIANHEGFTLLKLEKPNKIVRATNCIDKQIDFITDLEAKGLTYTIQNEGVYFDSSKFKDYTKLAKLDIDGLNAGARVSIGGKKHLTDFALWKFSPKNKHRDMEWESPWGVGFPGWHIECSTIIYENLGESIDIHTGGIDHIPVHHTNEIAQSESRTGKQLSKVWFHNNHIKVNGSKMSKSLGNIITLDDIIKHGFDVDAFKLMVLSSHYQTEGNFSWDIIESASNRLRNWKTISSLVWQTTDDGADIEDDINASKENLLKYLSDNLRSPEAMTTIDQLADKLKNRLISHKSKQTLVDYIDFINQILNINLKIENISISQQSLLDERKNARNNNDWEKSDKLRSDLEQSGIIISDNKDQQIWSKN